MRSRNEALIRPAPFGVYTTPQFWDDPHISARMLALHLDPQAAPASRPHRFIDRSVDWIVSELGLSTGSRVLDLGCGPGLYACRLARRGIEVTGIDVSSRSVRHARSVAAAEGLPAAFHEGSYLEADLGDGYDAALLIYEDFCALSPVQRAGLLTRTRSALSTGGGVLLFDVTAAPRFDQVEEGVVRERDLMAGFWAEPPYEGTHETWKYPDLRLVLNRYTIVRGGTTRQYSNWMHCLTPAAVAAELRSAGYDEPAVHGDVAGADYDPDSPTFAVLASRPGV